MPGLRGAGDQINANNMKFAYADPPYFKMGKRMYSEFHDDAAIWDDKQTHLDLITRLDDEYSDGWALSCNPANLSWILPAAPGLRICAWTKTFHQIRPTSIQFAWEAVLLRGGRSDIKRKPMVRDWMMGAIAMQTGLPGAKPLEFNLWILDLLNYQNGDELHDLFPGTNGMANAIEFKHMNFKLDLNV
jgi:hypothetical protein